MPGSTVVEVGAHHGMYTIALEVHLDDIGRYGSSVDELAVLLRIENRRVEMMIRARDWDTLTPFRTVADHPFAGTVNPFSTPVEQDRHRVDVKDVRT